MPYIHIEDFRAGLDVRRMAATTAPGALWYINNAWITRGGEIEKRKRFMSVGSYTSNIIGMISDGLDIYLVGTAASETIPTISDEWIPTPLYHQLDTTGWGGSTLDSITDYTNYDGKFYVVAQDDAGARAHFYDGSLVTWVFSGDNRGYQDVTRSVITNSQKVYAGSGLNLFFSAVGDPTDWGGAGAGTGFSNLGIVAPAREAITALANFRDMLAVFFSHDTILWQTDPDPSLSFMVQELPNIGCLVDRSIQSYGSHNIIFLSSAGVRSLRPHYEADVATMSDIGTPIDDIVTSFIPWGAKSIIEPSTGQYWLWIGDGIFVYSQFQDAKVNAWSTFTPGFVVKDVDVWQGTTVLALDDSNNLYVYGGGKDSSDYDNTEAEISLPFLDAQNPAQSKIFDAVDCAIYGTWTMEITLDPDTANDDPQVKEEVGTFDNITYDKDRMPISAEGTHIQVHMISTFEGPARIADMAIHYHPGATD